MAVLSESPSGLTKRQKRLAEVVASGQADSISDAGRRAGYSHPSTTHESLQKPIVQREIARLRGEQSDTARSIRKRALAKLSPALDAEDDAVRLSMVVKAMADVESTVSEADDSPIVERGADYASARLCAAYRAGVKAHALGHDTAEVRRALAELEPPGVGPIANHDDDVSPSSEISVAVTSDNEGVIVEAVIVGSGVGADGSVGSAAVEFEEF